jgi:hypothetical protein
MVPEGRRLLDWLKENKNSRFIRGVRVTESSRLPNLEFLQALPQLEDLWIESKAIRDFSGVVLADKLYSLKILIPRRTLPLPDLAATRLREFSISATKSEDIACIGRMTSLKTLVVLHWPQRNFEGLEHLALDEIILKGPQVVELSGLQRKAFKLVSCGLCTKLESVDCIDMERLNVERCLKLNLKSINSVVLVKLDLRDMVELGSLEFLDGCPNLQDLVITATKLRSPDLLPVIKLKKLQRFLLPPKALSVATMKKLSSDVPNAIISDGLNAYRDGTQVDVRSAYAVNVLK